MDEDESCKYCKCRNIFSGSFCGTVRERDMAYKKGRRLNKKRGSLSNSVDEEFWEGIKQLIVA